MVALVDPRPALRALLLGEDTIAAEIIDRIEYAILPQNPTVPAITFVQISSQTDHHSGGPSGLTSGRWQFNAWGRKVDDAVALGLLVKGALDGFSGPAGYGSDSPQDTVTIRGIFARNESDLYDEDAKLFFRQMDFDIWFAEF